MGILNNKYGCFSDDGKEYLISRSDTPMPWINVISNGDYGLTLSQAGSGYSWRTNASLNRITRWEQDLIRDEWGKYLYLRDVDTGEYWSVGRQPCGEGLEDYQVRHGMGYSVISGRRGSLQSEVTYTVPMDAPCELWLLRLSNQSEKTRHLQIFSYFEWGLGVAPDWHREFDRIFIETSYEPERGVLMAGKLLWDLPREKEPHWNQGWPYVAFHSASVRPVGFDSDKRGFLGRHGRLSQPAALQEGRSLGTSGRWGDPIGSLQVEIEIAPGTSEEVTFVLGAANDREQALTLADHFRHPEAARQTLQETTRFWHELTGNLQVETPDQAFNLMGNGWLTYQVISGRLWGRTAYYQMGGAYGYRDQLQDSLIWLLLGKPEKTLEQIRLHAAHQYQEGIVLHWWHPLSETGLRSNYSDDLLWLPFAVLYYIRETGDTLCLQEEMPFYDGGSASLLSHCLRSFEKALSRRSPRGLPLILEADWNDGLNAVGAGGQGESIWMAHFLFFLLDQWSLLPILEQETAEHFKSEAAALREAANSYGWDGAWYRRATTDQGKVLGSSACVEGKIFLNAQTWAVLSGLAPADRARQAMASARHYLFKQFGPLLLTPAYSIPDPQVGYLTRYAPGTRENGGVYVHAACWAIQAERIINGVEAAYRLWRSFCPAVRGEEPDSYMGEPYVMSGSLDGPTSEYPGRGGWTWYTGSAAWNLRAMISGVLGLEATFEGLQLKAELPEEWSSYRIVRPYRGAIYDITVRRGAVGDLKTCQVNGELWEEELLPLAPPGTIQKVEVVLTGEVFLIS